MAEKKTLSYRFIIIIFIMLISITLNFTGCPTPNSSDDTDGESISWEVNNLTTWADAQYGISNGGNGKTYIITVSGNVTIPPTTSLTNTFGSIKNTTIIIQGTGTITISDNGYMLYIGNGQTVRVKNLTLQGRNNTGSLIGVSSGGTFRMEGSSRVTGNTASSSSNSSDIYAGGVRISGGTFIMQDEAVVSNNTANTSGINREARGGGVYLGSGSFTMRDNAKVENNTASISSSVNNANGGGVYVDGGTFTMEGGSISENKVNGGSYGNARGGGVFVNTSGNFIMRNGTISGNTLNSADMVAWGGGVFGAFTMYNGTIKDNKVTLINTGNTGLVEARGGGVNGTLTMHGGTISGNTVIAGRTYGNNDVYAFGGGVYGSLTMDGGTISGNTVSASNDINAERATANGGGVYAMWSFTKNSGGTIYGNSAAGDLKNIANGGKGHAVFYVVLGGGNNWRNATAGPSDTSARLDFWLNE